MAAKKATKPAREVARPRVQAGPCPTNPAHESTKVYKTAGRVRHCKCDDCGSTWKVMAEYADDDKAYLHDIAEQLDAAEREMEDGQPVVLVTDGFATDLAKRLREIAASPVS